MDLLRGGENYVQKKYSCSGRLITGEEAPPAMIYAYSVEEAQKMYYLAFGYLTNQIAYAVCILSAFQDEYAPLFPYDEYIVQP